MRTAEILKRIRTLQETVSFILLTDGQYLTGTRFAVFNYQVPCHNMVLEGFFDNLTEEIGGKELVDISSGVKGWKNEN